MTNRAEVDERVSPRTEALAEAIATREAELREAVRTLSGWRDDDDGLVDRAAVLRLLGAETEGGTGE